MPTTLSKRFQCDPDAPYGREQIRKQRDARREAVLALLDRVDRPNAYAMRSGTIAERAGLAKQSVAQTIGQLVREGIVVKGRDKHGSPAYLLAVPEAKRSLIESRDATDAIALYRAEKAKREQRGKTYQQTLAEAKQELERLERMLADVAQAGAKRARGAQRAGETTRRKAQERRSAQH